MLDESSLVSRFATAAPQPNLERGQRTDEPEDLDENAVRRDRDVSVYDAVPAKSEQPAKDHEHDKAEVRDQDDVGQHAKNHVTSLVGFESGGSRVLTECTTSGRGRHSFGLGRSALKLKAI